MSEHSNTFYLVKSILERADDYEWTIQGLGMLRTYLAPEIRLHVWDDRLAVEGVSEMHTHPWNFHSEVIAGEVGNTRFVESDDPDHGYVYNRQTIKCGEGGGLVGGPELVHLKAQPEEIYTEGYNYQQLAHEIHVSRPARGTVTIVRREFLDDTDHAYVFWPEREEWVSAEPQTASKSEVFIATQRALARWFGGDES